MNTGYSAEQIESFKKTAKDIGVHFVLIHSAQDLTIYINDKFSAENDPTTKSRTQDLVSDITIFGHGQAETIEFGYNPDGFKLEMKLKVSPEQPVAPIPKG